jgi:hypothetical protein
MNKPKPRATPATAERPGLGQGVIVRSPFFAKPTVGILIGTYDDDSNDVVVVAFPVGRDSLQIPAIPYFLTEPDATVRSAVWPA